MTGREFGTFTVWVSYSCRNRESERSTRYCGGGEGGLAERGGGREGIRGVCGCREQLVVEKHPRSRSPPPQLAHSAYLAGSRCRAVFHPAHLDPLPSFGHPRSASLVDAWPALHFPPVLYPVLHSSFLHRTPAFHYTYCTHKARLLARSFRSLYEHINAKGRLHVDRVHGFPQSAVVLHRVFTGPL